MTESTAPATASYKGYWIAWGVLLVITVIVVFLDAPALLIAGMVVKAGIIVLLYMHLGGERLGLILAVLLGLFATALLLAFLIMPDGWSDASVASKHAATVKR